MALLLDEAWSKVDPVQAFAAGYRGLIGYVSQDATGKNLTSSNVEAAHAAGLDVGIVYEYNPESALKAGPQGTIDASIAVTHADGLLVPHGVCLYAAVDFNATTTQMAEIRAYAEAFKTVAAGSGYRAGIYGGYLVCQSLHDQGYTGLLWQTYAWSGGAWADGVAVRQVRNDVHVAGADIDQDTSQVADWGQWFPAASPPPIPQGDFMINHWTTVQRGSTGQAVKDAEALLIAHGYSVGCPPTSLDGVFGPACEASTRAFQTKHGLQVDGQFGPHTLSVALYGVDVVNA